MDLKQPFSPPGVLFFRVKANLNVMSNGERHLHAGLATWLVQEQCGGLCFHWMGNVNLRRAKILPCVGMTYH
jgi:hypothetical protein